jgi:hypothetical protein
VYYARADLCQHPASIEYLAVILWRNVTPQSDLGCCLELFDLALLITFGPERMRVIRTPSVPAPARDIVSPIRQSGSVIGAMPG